MANLTAAQSTVGLLINNANPLPDGSVGSYNIMQVAAAGTTQATATALMGPVNVITNNTAANGVILPVGSGNQAVIVVPMLATNAPKVYPPVGGTINFGATNASVAATAQKGVEFRTYDKSGLNWYTIGL